MKKKKHIKLILFSAVIIIIIIAIFLLWNQKEENDIIYESFVTGTGIGKLAPDFKLKTPEGEEIQLSSFRNEKSVILNFWATWCGPCEEEMPIFQREYEKGEVQILAVNLQENGERAKMWFEERKFTIPILLDPNAVVKNLYGVFTQPATYFIDKNGIIRDKKFGQILENEINEKIQKIL